MTPEVRVGILFFAAIAVAFPSVIFVMGRWGWTRSQQITVQFSNVEGLSRGAKVLFLGMEIGRVGRIRLAEPHEMEGPQFRDKPIAVDLMLKRDVQLLSTDRFVIAQSGVLGDTHIAVRRETQQERERDARRPDDRPPTPAPLTSGARVTGEKAVGLTELGDQADVVLRRVADAIDDLRAVYAGPDMRERLPAILANVEAATGNAVEFSRVLARVSVENEARVGRIAREIAAAAGELNRSAQRVHELVATSAPHVEGGTARVARMIEATAANVEATGRHLEQTGGRVERMVDKSARDIEASTGIARASLERTAQNLEQAAQHVEDATAAVAVTTGVAGADLAATTARVKQLIEGSADNLETAAAQVERATTTMADLVEETSREVSAGTRRVGVMVHESAASVEAAAATLAAASETAHADLAAITGRTRSMIERSADDVEQTTARIARLTETSADDITRTTRRIHDLLATSPLPTDLGAAGGHIRRAAENIESLTGQFRETLADPELTTRIANTVTSLEQASGHIAAMAAEGEALVGDGREGLRRATELAADEEMWGHLRRSVASLNAAMDDLAAVAAHGREVFTDPGLSDDLRATVRHAREVSETGVGIAHKADSTLDRVDHTMSRLQSVASQLQPTFTAGRVDMHGTDSFGLRMDLAADLYFGDHGRNFWRFGIRDFGDADTLILQHALGLDSGAVARLGILGGKLSVGYDHRFGDRWSGEVDLWNLNDPRLDVRWLWNLNSRWAVSVGAEQVFSGTYPSVGVRREFTIGGGARD